MSQFNVFAIILFLGSIFCGPPVWAQIYQNKYDTVVMPMEKAIDRSRAETADFPVAGAREDGKPLTQRYEENVVPMNKASEQHFVIALQDKASNGQEPKP